MYHSKLISVLISPHACSFFQINKKKAVEGSDKSKDGATPSLQSEVTTGNDKQIDELLGMTA